MAYMERKVAHLMTISFFKNDRTEHTNSQKLAYIYIYIHWSTLISNPRLIHTLNVSPDDPLMVIMAELSS